MTDWIIECACLVCHGPMRRSRSGITPIVCSDACSTLWYQRVRKLRRREPGGLVALRRATQHYRRAQMLVALRLAQATGDPFAMAWMLEAMA